MVRHQTTHVDACIDLHVRDGLGKFHEQRGPALRLGDVKAIGRAGTGHDVLGIARATGLIVPGGQVGDGHPKIVSIDFRLPLHQDA